MGDFLENLKSARFTPVAIRQRFRIEYNSARADVYAFFESTDDDTFYRRYIVHRMQPEGRLRAYFCGNKQSVWYHYEFAEQEDKLFNTLFFVDKDLDDFTGHALPVRKQIFVTDYYSIENYICTEQAVASILEQVIFLPDEQDSYSTIVHEFRDGLEEFARLFRPLFAEIILMRQHNRLVLFSDFGDGLSPCFKMVGLRTRPLPNWTETFRARCKYEITELPPSDVEAMELSLAAKATSEWLRGKFALWFFLHFIENLWLSLVGKPINDRKKIKKTVDLKADTIFLTMQGRHPIPKNLEQFLSINIA
jgi:hypothetical protein